MEDPLPENIDGEKRVVHSVEHHINWGYALMALAALFVAWKVFGALQSSDETAPTGDDEEDGWADVAAESGLAGA